MTEIAATRSRRRRWRAGPAVWIPAAVVAVIVLFCAAGQFLAPHTPTEPVGVPYSGPGGGQLLGTDQLGRDVLSRILDGGVDVLVMAFGGAVVATAIGTLAGLAAAMLGARGAMYEGAVLRPFDTVAAIPPVLALILVLTAIPDRWGIVVAVAAAGAPLSARVVYSAARPIMARPHVELAIARGERAWWLLGRELLPLVAATIAADAGLRYVMALYLVTAAGFLGIDFGGTDWGTLIVEAMPGATMQPLALLAPLVLVATLAVAVNMWADAMLHRSRKVLG